MSGGQGGVRQVALLVSLTDRLATAAHKVVSATVPVAVTDSRVSAQCSTSLMRHSCEAPTANSTGMLALHLLRSKSGLGTESSLTTTFCRGTVPVFWMVIR